MLRVGSAGKGENDGGAHFIIRVGSSDTCDMRHPVACSLSPVTSALHPVTLISFPDTPLRLPNVVSTSFSFPRHRFRSRAPKRRRILLIPHQLHPRGRRHGIRVLREVRIRIGLFRQENLSRRALGKPIHLYWMGLYPIPKEIVDIFPRRCRLQGPRTSVRSRNFVTRIEQSRARGKQVGHVHQAERGERYLRDVTKRRTFAMECTRDLGGCKVEGSFEFLFRDRQHPFHPRHGAISFWRLLEVFEYLSDELRVLDWSGPHRPSKLNTSVSQAIESGRGRDTEQKCNSREGSSYTLDIFRRREDRNAS